MEVSMGNDSYNHIENVIRKNLDNRGMDHIELKGSLEKSAKELIKAETVIIVTGFVVRDSMTGETDGPIGAVSLASALEKLGKKVILITDEFSELILMNCCTVLGVKAPIEVAYHDSIEMFCIDIFENYKPSHVVAIERPGRAADGNCYSMRGEDLSDLVPNTDLIFEIAKKKGISTLAVGDGGNEVGMGLVREQVKDVVANGEKICAAVSTDILLLAGVSNWGGHAISGALSIMSGKKLLHNAQEEKWILESMIQAGAVDGCTKKNELTVDGLSFDENLEVLTSISSLVDRGLKATVINGM